MKRKPPWLDAWAAGIVDGDGCIAITRSGPYFRLKVSVGQSGQTLPIMLSTLRKFYRGSIPPKGMIEKTSKWNRRPRFAWDQHADGSWDVETPFEFNPDDVASCDTCDREGTVKEAEEAGRLLAGVGIAAAVDAFTDKTMAFLGEQAGKESREGKAKT
ncbi:MAG: hypothetical protein ACRDQZ_07745 [Mycobacteriales bacterium]